MADFQSDNSESADVRQLQLELNEANSKISVLQANATAGQTAGSTTTATTTRPLISNIIRNGDVNHSFNTWFKPAPSGGKDELECANVYAHPAIAETRVPDGAIVAADNTLTCGTSMPFVSGDVGKRVIILGAGTAGAPLVTTIASFTSASSVELTDPAVTTVTNATTRFGMVKLTHKTFLTNPGDTVNDTLKDPAHSAFSSNIQDPHWQKSDGVVFLGSRNFLCFPLGYYEYVQGDGAGNGTNYIALNTLYPDRPVFARVNVARATAYIKPKGQLFLALFNNDDSVLDFAHGVPFNIDVNIVNDGSSGALTSTVIYMIIAETDQGYSIVSEFDTEINAPNATQYSAQVYVTLRWEGFAGAINYKIYRKIDAGNVFELESDQFETANYIDNNPATRIDTGTTAFPNPAVQVDAVKSYIAVNAVDLQQAVVNGSGPWNPIEGIIPFSSTIDMKTLFDPCLLIGLTEDVSIEVSDVVTNGTATITSAAGQFTADMAGMAFALSDPANPAHTQTGTVSSFTDANTVVLDASVAWSSTDNVFEILGAGANGLLLDLIGAGPTPGDFDYHIEDRAGRPQNVAANPEGSSQGGIGGSGGGTGGGDSGGSSGDTGGVIITTPGSCMLAQDRENYTQLVLDNGDIVRIPVEEVKEGDHLYFGIRENGKPLFNIVKSVKFHDVTEILSFEMGYASLPVTGTHRFVSSHGNFKTGFEAAGVYPGENLLRVTPNGYTLMPVLNRFIRTGNFHVIEIELEDNGGRDTHLMIINDTLVHNLKQLPDENPITF